MAICWQKYWLIIHIFWSPLTIASHMTFEHYFNKFFMSEGLGFLVIPCQLDQIWRVFFGHYLRTWWNFHHLFVSLANENPENFSFFDQRGFEMSPLEFWPILTWGWFLSFGPFLRAYNSAGSKVMNLKFSVLNNCANVLQKKDI